ncbi:MULTISPECIES: alpha/beta fold hydrolase [unclassified Jeotgalibaca]|uniref:alpha/beta fold hydrolase n=1 Tax=unclassified Jeotgalibaca TaxID=2621505 RepID=UPI003FD35554
MEKMKLTAKDSLGISIAIYAVDDPIGVVQIIHGSKEHKGRYADFCSYLQKEGFAVVIADIRGHGESINEANPFGFMDGPDRVIEDQLLVTDFIKKRYPEKEIYLFGHSLGSLFARIYIQNHDHLISKLVMTGTVNYVYGVEIAEMYGRLLTRLRGKDGDSLLIRLIKKIQGEEAMTWVSVNKDNLMAIKNDPMIVKEYANISLLTIIQADRMMHLESMFECKNPALKILSLTGDGDPVTGRDRGLSESLTFLKKVGYKYITKMVYHGMNHEVLNEENNGLVYKDIVRFLKK